MEEKKRNKISKFLSLILRHTPDMVGLQLDENGWADVEDLLARSAGHGNIFSREELAEVTATSDKLRFSFSEDKTRIRANQGHSIEVELQLEEKIPPVVLYQKRGIAEDEQASCSFK